MARMSDNPKWFMTSKTIIGIIISAAGLILDASSVEAIETATNTLLALAPEIVQASGLIVATIGRFFATKPLKAAPGDG